MKTITPAELAAIDGATIIDVREPDEYAAAHVPGSTLLPLGEVVERFRELPADRPLYILCRSGARSGQAAAWLAAQGVDATNITGGIIQWHRDGLPVNLAQERPA